MYEIKKTKTSFELAKNNQKRHIFWNKTILKFNLYRFENNRIRNYYRLENNLKKIHVQQQIIKKPAKDASVPGIEALIHF